MNLFAEHKILCFYFSITPRLKVIQSQAFKYTLSKKISLARVCIILHNIRAEVVDNTMNIYVVLIFIEKRT